MIQLDASDTIAAIASPPGPAPRGIIRLSGARSAAIASIGFRALQPKRDPGRPHRVEGVFQVGGLRPPVPGFLVVWPTARSYTGEPMVEIHTVGAPPILQAILAYCLAGGARLAEPGEFTLRAFLSGRIDLTRAEAVLAVIESRNAKGLEVALSQLAGGIARPIHTLKDRLLGVLAHLEANLDFAEEPDVDRLARERLLGELQAADFELSVLTRTLGASDRPRPNPRVVLVGPPNAGKSRLFNSLLGDDRAIVSPVAGTTRDYIAAPLRCGNLVVELIDTAGDDQAQTAIDEQSQAFRREQADKADLLLICSPAGAIPVSIEPGAVPSLQVITKSDLGGESPSGSLRTSSETGEGLVELCDAVHRALTGDPTDSSAVLETSVRCRDSLIQASEALQSAKLALQQEHGDELVAIDLRRSLDDLGRVVGEVVTDDILDQIFRRFCIGK